MNFLLQATLALGMATAIGSAHAGDAPNFLRVGPPDYQVTDMTSDGSVVVGSFIFGSPAFRWTREGGTELLGGNGGLVRVSDDGTQISGNLLVDGHNEAARWLGGTDWSPLGGFSDSGCPDFSNNYAISGDGLVIAGLGWDGCFARAFRWEESTGMVDLGSMIAGRSSRANAVNVDGSIIVGWDDAEDGSRRGARWVNQVESLLIDNTGPGIFLGEGQAVTPDGSVIVGGPAGPLTGRWDQAYVWTEAAGGMLIGNLPGGGQNASAFAFAVSDDGTVAAGASGGSSRDAFVWTQETGIFNLQDYLLTLGVPGIDGWRLDTVLAMSGDGRMLAGWGINPMGRVQGWLVENLPPFTDGDGDGVLDAVDNCSLLPNVDQRDTDADGFGNRCDPDFNNDNKVNFIDVGFLRSVFMTADEDADLNGDGMVNFQDVGIIKSFMFGPPGPGVAEF